MRGKTAISSSIRPKFCATKSPGWAKKDYTLSDGVHLSKEAVTAYFQYVRTHALLTEDRRPQPLGTISEPAGVPLGLISSDPIAVRGAKVPVEFVVDGNGSISGRPQPDGQKRRDLRHRNSNRRQRMAV